MLTLVLFAALAIPPQQINVTSEMNSPVVPDQVLAWQLEGLTQEEIQDEVEGRGLTQCADEPLFYKGESQEEKHPRRLEGAK